MSGLASGTVCVCVLEGDSVCERERGGGGVFMCIFFIAALEVEGPGPGPDGEIVHDECCKTRM